MPKKAHLGAVQSEYRAAADETSGLWFHRLHSQPWLRWSPRWPTDRDPPEKQGKETFVQDNVRQNKAPFSALINALMALQMVVEDGACVPRWTAVCCAAVSIKCPPWCPRLGLYSTPPLLGPGQGGLFRCQDWNNRLMKKKNRRNAAK